MPTVEQNQKLWSEEYDWSHMGDRWSAKWGGVDMHWYGTLLPRIHAFLPAGTILEIASGYGRWSHYLKDACDHLILIDLQEHCIEACKKRFADESHIEYYVTDGKSLDMVADNSVDFVFSFDSLVHVESDVIEAYLAQLSQKLTANGVGFIHHSNLGEFESYFSMMGSIPAAGRNQLHRRGLIDKDHWRGQSMTAEKFCQLAASHGLQCIGQEVINWSTKREIDCLSVFCKEGASWARPNVVLRNGRFMDVVQQIGELSRVYGESSWPQPD